MSKRSVNLLRGQMSPIMQMAGNRVATKVTTEDVTLTAADSGKVIFLDGSSTHDVTLPSAATGLTFTFFLVDATADVDIVQAAAAEDFVGNITAHNGKDTAEAGDTKIIFDQTGGAKVGDWVQLTCYNDDDWYVVGLSNTAAAVVFNGA